MLDPAVPEVCREDMAPILVNVGAAWTDMSAIISSTYARIKIHHRRLRREKVEKKPDFFMFWRVVDGMEPMLVPFERPDVRMEAKVEWKDQGVDPS
jgi:hypothetical protein